MPSYEGFRALRRFPGLDGLRAVSILMVLTWHVNSHLWQRLEGWEGVTIFFVISGFLITTLCLREEALKGRVSLLSFYVRRAFRILPLYYLVLIVYVIFVIGANSHGHKPLLMDALPYFLSYTNDFAPLQGNTPFAQSWSLGVEEKFYLVWPAIAFVMLTARHRLRPVVAGVLAVAPFVLLPLNALGWFSHYAAIMVGCLLALVLHDERCFKYVRLVATPVGATAALAVLVGLHVAIPSGEPVRLAYPFAVAAVMIPIIFGNLRLTGLLRTRSMRFLGNLAYGVYLVHLMVLSVLVSVLTHIGVGFDASNQPTGGWGLTILFFILGGIGSFALAFGLNRAVEAPLIARGRLISERLGQRRQSRATEETPVAVGVAGEVAAP